MEPSCTNLSLPRFASTNSRLTCGSRIPRSKNALSLFLSSCNCWLHVAAKQIEVPSKIIPLSVDSGQTAVLPP
jgi:hypothetical protein